MNWNKWFDKMLWGKTVCVIVVVNANRGEGVFLNNWGSSQILSDFNELCDSFSAIF